jgi:5-methylcytosine-specific restriction endonuclease McrA
MAYAAKALSDLSNSGDARMANYQYLPDWHVTAVQRPPGLYLASASFGPTPTTCAKCDAQIYKHGTKPVNYRDAPARGRQVLIKVNRKRYRCRSCFRTFLQPLPDMEDNHRLTIRCRNYVIDQAFLRPLTEIARDIGIDEKTVRQVAGEHIDFRARVISREGLAAAKQEMMKCLSCKALFPRPVIVAHHIVPLSNSGQRASEDQILLCANCHRLCTDQWFKRRNQAPESRNSR